jgi:hypothetical protein
LDNTPRTDAINGLTQAIVDLVDADTETLADDIWSALPKQDLSFDAGSQELRPLLARRRTWRRSKTNRSCRRHEH